MIGPYGEPNEAQQRVPFDAIQSRKRMVLVTRARSVLDMCKNVLEIDEDGIVHDPDADRIAAFAAEVAEEAHGPGSAIFDAIRQERLRQERLKAEGKFMFSASTADLGIAVAILMEEVGEVAREAMALLGVVKETGDRARYRKELIQVAAVSVAMIEASDTAALVEPEPRG